MVAEIKNEQQIVKDLEGEFIAACQRADIDKLDSLLADGYIFTDPNGVILTKSDWLEDMKSGEFRFESLAIHDLVVHVAKPIASAKVKLSVKAKSKKGHYDGIYSAMDIYENRGGKWLIILSTANQLLAHS